MIGFAEALLRVGGSLRSAFHARDVGVALPAALALDVGDGPLQLSFEDYCRIYERIRPVYLTVSARGDPLGTVDLPRMVAHATSSGCRVCVVTDGVLLDAGRAHALLEAGLSRLDVCINLPHPDGAAEIVFRNLEKFVAMRDALRKSGPVIGLQFVVFRGGVGQVDALLARAGVRLPGIDAVLVVPSAECRPVGPGGEAIPLGDRDTLAALGRIRARSPRRTVGSIDAAIIQLTRGRASTPCRVPWYSAHVSAAGALYPCRHHASNGAGMGDARERPFAEIWNGGELAAFRSALRSRRPDAGVCATCPHHDLVLERVYNVLSSIIRIRR